MTNREKRLSVVIARLEPIHIGHAHTINTALDYSQNTLLILGSVNQPRTIRNPFTFAEREEMVRQTFKTPRRFDDMLHIRGAEDNLYSDTAWVSSIQTIVNEVLQDLPEVEEVLLLGHKKYPAESYDFMFPQYKSVEAGTLDVKGKSIDATVIRELMFESKFAFLQSVLPKPVQTWLADNFFFTDAFENLVEEFQFIKKYKEQWSTTPYPVLQQTVDAVVLCGGHVLLIKRKSAPGRGLWALPGGFLNENERFTDGTIRELREETGLKISARVLRKNTVCQERFDHPERSLRGRTITEASLITLDPMADGSLPPVRGADDAEKAKWIPLSEALAMRSQLFEDHHDIITALSSRAK